MAEFWFKGKRASEFNLLVLSISTPIRSATRQAVEDVPGMDGGALTWDTSRLSTSRTVECFLPMQYNYRLDDIYAWLVGWGQLVTTDMPGRYMIANPISEIAPQMDADGVLLELVFVCEPYRYLDPPQRFSLREHGTINNPGTAKADPIIWVYGSGTGTVVLGDQTIQILDQTDDIQIDTPAQMCSHPESVIMDAFPVFDTGSIAIRWSGGVTGVDIQPGWRFL